MMSLNIVTVSNRTAKLTKVIVTIISRSYYIVWFSSGMNVSKQGKR